MIRIIPLYFLLFFSIAASAQSDESDTKVNIGEYLNKLDRIYTENQNLLADIRLLEEEVKNCDAIEYVVQNELSEYERDLSDLSELLDGEDSIKAQTKYKYIQQLVDDRKSTLTRCSSTREELITKRAEYKRNDADFSKTKGRLEAYTDETNKIDNFRTYVSIGFAALVGIVLFGFFGLAFVQKDIGSQLFANNQGIQFFTLFLLVIAIILFGIIGILEGKELSALIGGISGYILGKSGIPSFNGNNGNGDGGKKDEEE